MRERRDFLCFFSGNSLIRCIELLIFPCEFRRGATFSKFRMSRDSGLLRSIPSDFLMRGRFVDSLSARGFFFTASTSSDTELVAISFWRAEKTRNKKREKEGNRKTENAYIAVVLNLIILLHLGNILT